MTKSLWKTLTLGGVLIVALSFAGCSKKATKAVPPAAPPPAAPTATLAANPAVIEQCQTTTLTWKTDNASDVTIDGIGAVSGSGSRTLTPGSSTTYTLTAKGPGGIKDASARVTVNEKEARATTPHPSDEDLFARNVADVLFDYNKSDIRTDQSSTVHNDAAFLAQHPSINVVVEGHCDDRGSEEYNLALGTSRAESVRQALLGEGVSADRIKTVSYGKEKPFCTDENDQCWQQNRVDHFNIAR